MLTIPASANCTVGIDPVLQYNGRPERRLLCWGSDSPAVWVGALPLLSSVTTDVMKVLDKTLQTLCLLAVQRMSQRFRRRWLSVSGRLQAMLLLTSSSCFLQAVGRLAATRTSLCAAHARISCQLLYCEPVPYVFKGVISTCQYTILWTLIWPGQEWMCLLLGVNVSTSLRNKRPKQKTSMGFQ